VRNACRRYGMQCNFLPESQVFQIHKNGRAIQTFNISDFYQLPKRYRMFMYKPLIQSGLARNLGERTVKEGLFGNYKIGKKII
jgi:hypothetical protein